MVEVAEAAARRTADGATWPGPGVYEAVMVVFGKASSSVAATSLVMLCATSGLISVMPEVISWRQMNEAVRAHCAPDAHIFMSLVTGVILIIGALTFWACT